jgi:hypothetical protein
LSYDCDGKIVAVELYFVTNLIHARSVQGERYFVISTSYYEESDILKISFVNYTPPVIKLKRTAMKDIEMEVDNAEKIVSLLFYNVSNRIFK